MGRTVSRTELEAFLCAVGGVSVRMCAYSADATFVAL